MPFGQIDTADLKMTSCDFEKDANAEVLFDKGIVRFESGLSMKRHIRIKIFNDFGGKNANIRFIYHNDFLEGTGIGSLEAETINLEGNKIVITPLDKTQIYTEKINKNFSALIFTFPNVKAGSIIEYKFKCYPQQQWFFQNSLPTRYSELEINTHNVYDALGAYSIAGLQFQLRVSQPLAVDTKDEKNGRQIMALANIHSLPDETYMTARRNNLQRLEFLGHKLMSSWGNISNELISKKGFGSKLDDSLVGESAILKKTEALKNDDERIAFIFDTVRNLMKWNKETFFIANEEIKSAWRKKTGNSASINLIVYHLLDAIGIKVYPMVVCTRDYGRINPENPDIFSLNNTVVYIPVDSTKFYILDASSKFNLFNTIPYNILDSYGLSINLSDGKYSMVPISNKLPVVQSIFLNAEIKPDGKITGNAEITSESYNKIGALKKYYTDGEEKYVDSLHKMYNTVKILSFKMDNMKVDTLPLSQKISFNIDLTASDSGYIYFNTNLFTFLEDNPFKSEQRFSDIDLGFMNNYSIQGIYKIPAEYKVDALPKNMSIVMPDQSIVFKRTIAQDSGTIYVRYFINHKRTVYFMEEYQDIRGFYKKMHELLNEQIVLKKL